MRIISPSLLLLTALLGCGKPVTDKYEVTGMVTLDGEPLAQGEIFFVATNNSSSEAGKIADGRYRVKTAAGDYKIIINASVRTRNPNPPEMRGDEWYFASIIPVRYNDQTVLRAVVAADAENKHDFALNSAAP